MLKLTNMKTMTTSRLSGWFARAAVAGALVLAPALAQADDSADDRLEERVEKSLGNDSKLSRLDVDVKDGVATLTGEVASAADKTRAARLAKSSGAKEVINKVEVDPDKAVAAIKDRAEQKKDRIDERAEAAKAAVDRQTEVATDRAERTGTVAATGTANVPASAKTKDVIDPLVTAKVKTRIVNDDLLDKSDINVDSESDGLVTLKGTVPSEAAHTRALELARATDGVRKVVDKLSIKAPVVK